MKPNNGKKTKLMVQYAETNYENALWNILNCTS